MDTDLTRYFVNETPDDGQTVGVPSEPEADDVAGKLEFKTPIKHDSLDCSRCGCKLPGTYRLNAMFYGAGDGSDRQGQLELGYACFICGKRICPDCARRYGYTRGAFLACSKECGDRLWNLEGLPDLWQLMVADDMITELFEGEYRAPFYWGFQCPRCRREHDEYLCDYPDDLENGRLPYELK